MSRADAATQLRRLASEARAAMNPESDDDFMPSATNLIQSTSRLFRRRPEGTLLNCNLVYIASS